MRELIIRWMGEISDYMRTGEGSDYIMNGRDKWLYEKCKRKVIIRETWLYDEQERCDCMMNGRDKWLYKKQEKEVKCKRWLYEKRDRSDYMNKRIKRLCEKREMKVIIWETREVIIWWTWEISDYMRNEWRKWLYEKCKRKVIVWEKWICDERKRRKWLCEKQKKKWLRVGKVILRYKQERWFYDEQ